MIPLPLHVFTKQYIERLNASKVIYCVQTVESLSVALSMLLHLRGFVRSSAAVRRLSARCTWSVDQEADVRAQPAAILSDENGKWARELI